jgi:hypothetical protein
MAAENCLVGLFGVDVGWSGESFELRFFEKWLCQ